MTGALVAALRDPRYLAWSAVAAVGGLVVFGLVTAIIPNPVFGRSIPPEPFAIATWIASAVLMGLLAGTYLVPAPAAAVDLRLPAAPLPGSSPVAGSGPGTPPAPEERRTSLLGYAGGFAAFLAIGCPVCNKVALVALGTSGALSIWAPLQPIVALASLALLAGALAWRFRVRARGGACAVA